MINKKGFNTTSQHTGFLKKDVYNVLYMTVYDGVAFDFETSEDLEKVFRGNDFKLTKLTLKSFD